MISLLLGAIYNVKKNNCYIQRDFITKYKSDINLVNQRDKSTYHCLGIHISYDGIDKLMEELFLRYDHPITLYKLTRSKNLMLGSTGTSIS